MAEIKSPISGGLRVARRTVSANAFASAAPAPPAISQPDPVTTSLIQRNSLALNTVSEQLSSLTQQVNSLNVAMQNVYGNVNQSASLERRKDTQEQDQERRLAEQQLREGKESIIERRIQNALVSPVQKVAAKASFTLSRIMQFFTTLLGGWLINQGIETIKALGDDNKQKLEEIRNSVLKNLGIIGGIYGGIRFGLTAVFNVLTRVAARITTAVAVGLFLRPVQALLDGVKGAANKIIPKIKNILPRFSKPGGGGGGNPPPAGDKEPPKTPPKTTSEAPKQVDKKGINIPSPTNLLGPLLGGGIGGAYDISQGEDPGKAIIGNIGGAFTSGALASGIMRLPLSPIIKVPASLAAGFFSYGPATDMFKGFYDKTTEMFGTNPGVTSSQPIQSKVPDIVSESQKQDFTQPAQYGEILISQLIGTETINLVDAFNSTSLKTPIAEITPIKQEATMKAESVGPLPEPVPTIIPMPMSGKMASKPKSTNQSSDPATSIPSIDPENPNNFYVVYSHSVYNVPMT